LVDVVNFDQFRNGEDSILLRGTSQRSSFYVVAISRTGRYGPVSLVWFAVRDSVRRRFVWIPVFLGLAGVLGIIFLMAVPANLILGADVATVGVFIVSFELLNKKQISPPERIKHRQE
jgi:hypothetical protein